MYIICYWNSCLINLELLEETGITSSDIDIDPNFRFEQVSISYHCYSFDFGYI
jgi:hypothetical protein